MLEKGNFDVTTYIEFPDEKFLTKGSPRYSIAPCLNVARFGSPDMIGGDILRAEGIDFEEIGNILYFPGRDCYIQTNALGAACLEGNLEMVQFILPQIWKKQVNLQAIKKAAKTPIMS